MMVEETLIFTETEVDNGRATLEFGIRESADSFSRASGRATVYLV